MHLNWNPSYSDPDGHANGKWLFIDELFEEVTQFDYEMYCLGLVNVVSCCKGSSLTVLLSAS